MGRKDSWVRWGGGGVGRQCECSRGWMTGAVEVGPGVLWPCIAATRRSLPAPLSTAFLGPKEKRHLLVCLDGLIALAAFTLKVT